MERRRFIEVIAGGLLAAPLVSEAQPAGRIPRLCFLTFTPGTLQSSAKAIGLTVPPSLPLRADRVIDQ